MSNYEPISGYPTPILKNGRNELAIGYWIKCYKSGTDTPLAMAVNRQATNNLGQPFTVFKLQVGDKGILQNPSQGDCVPHVNEPYKIALFKTSTQADNNDLNNAEWVVDGLQLGQIGLIEDTAPTESSEINYRFSSNGVSRTVEARLKNQAFIDDFNITLAKDGTVDWTAIFATASANATTIIVTPGVYLIDQISCNTDGQSWVFQAGVTLKARSNDKAMFYQSASNCKHEGTFTVNSNSKTGIYGIAVAPADMAQTSTVTNQTGNTLPGVICDSGTAEGIVLQPGPEVSSVLSKNENNVLPLVIGGTRSVWLKDPANATAGQSRNNTFERIYTATGSNTGVQIDNGKNNTFVAPGLKDVATGTSPNTTPTGFKIAETSPATSAANTGNVILGGYCDGCTRDIEMVISSNSIFGLDYDTGNSITT